MKASVFCIPGKGLRIHVAAWRCSIVLIGFAPLIAWSTAADAAGIYFSEDFNAAVENPNLFGYEHFTIANGVIRRNGQHGDVNDRQYLRTTASHYNEVDFRYELTFTTSNHTQTSLNYIGIGRGNRRPGSSFGHNEPWESLYFRIHNANFNDGYITVSNHPVSDLVLLGDIPNPGTHRARIDKVGNAITFSIDRHYNGMFVADMSHTFPNLAEVAPFLTNQNSRLFFGTVFPNDSFDNMLVTLIPEPGSFALFGIATIVLTMQKRRRVSA